MPKQGVMKCSGCSYTQGEGIIKDKKKKSVDIAVIEKKSTETLPKTKYDCKNCNNNEA